MNAQKSVIAGLLGSTIIAGAAIAQQTMAQQTACGPGQKGPCVTYAFRQAGNATVENRVIDCSLAPVIQSSDGKKGLGHTYKFFQQADTNMQLLKADPNPMPQDLATRWRHSQEVLRDGVYHYGRVHFECFREAAAFDVAAMRERKMSDADISAALDRIYPPGWRTNTTCSYKAITNGCEAAFGLR